MTYVIAIVLFALGATGILAGGADDSPGLQLLGVLIIVGAVVLSVRTARRRRVAPQSR